jgi:hypothetical protein
MLLRLLPGEGERLTGPVAVVVRVALGREAVVDSRRLFVLERDKVGVRVFTDTLGLAEIPRDAGKEELGERERVLEAPTRLPRLPLAEAVAEALVLVVPGKPEDGGARWVIAGDSPMAWDGEPLALEAGGLRLRLPVAKTVGPTELVTAVGEAASEKEAA